MQFASPTTSGPEAASRDGDPPSSLTVKLEPELLGEASKMSGASPTSAWRAPAFVSASGAPPSDTATRSAMALQFAHPHLGHKSKYAPIITRQLKERLGPVRTRAIDMLRQGACNPRCRWRRTGYLITVGEVRTQSAIDERERHGRRSADGRLLRNAFAVAASSVRIWASALEMSGLAMPLRREADADARIDRPNAAGEPPAHHR